MMVILVDDAPIDTSLLPDSDTTAGLVLPRFARLRLLLSALLWGLSVFVLWVSRVIARAGVRLAVLGRRLVDLSGLPPAGERPGVNPGR